MRRTKTGACIREGKRRSDYVIFLMEFFGISGPLWVHRAWQVRDDAIFGLEGIHGP